MINQTNNVTNIINIGNVNVVFVFVKIAVGFAIIFTIYKFIKWFLKRMKFDKKFVIELSTGGGLLKGHYISVGITNIGSEKIWIDKVGVILDNEIYIEIECNKCLETQQQECFEKRYSQIIQQDCVLGNYAKKYFIFYKNKNDHIYMIECGKKIKHKLIKVKKYNSYIRNAKQISFAIYNMDIMNGNKEKQKIIFDPNMIYIIQFLFRKDIESNWQFHCLATIDTNGTFISYNRFLLSKNGEPFNEERIDKHILKYPDKIVDFIRNNWIDTNFNDISDIYYTTTPEAMVLSGEAIRV